MGTNTIITGKVVTPSIQSAPFSVITQAATAMDAQLIAIGDTDHTDPLTRFSLSGKQLITSLAEAGVTQLALEIPHLTRNLIERYQAGEIDRDSLKNGLKETIHLVNAQGELTKEEFIESIARTLDHAKTACITITAIDPGVGFDGSYRNSPEADEAYMQLARVYVSQGGYLSNFISADEGAAFQQWIKNLGKEGLEKILTHKQLDDIIKNEEQRLEARLDDTELAKAVDELRLGNPGEKVAIIYGAGHDNFIAKLQELTDNNVLVVDVHSNGRNFYRFNEGGTENKPGHHPAGDPELIIVLEDGPIIGPGETGVYVTNKTELKALEALAGQDRSGIEEGQSPRNGWAPRPDYQAPPPPAFNN